MIPTAGYDDTISTTLTTNERLLELFILVLACPSYHWID